MPLPPSAQFFFDNSSPYSTDTIQVQIVDAVDPDCDPLAFQYDWHVNGQLVQRTASSATTATLDLSQPGCGDRGDVIAVTVTPSAGIEEGGAVSLATTLISSSPS